MDYEINPAPLYANGVIVFSKSKEGRAGFCATDRIDLINTLSAFGLEDPTYEIFLEGGATEIKQHLNAIAPGREHIVLDYPTWLKKVASGEPPVGLTSEENIDFAKALQWVVPIKSKN